ncbi:MAG: phospho-N-acetylmuramoyl-pentapeptide-transferase [Candidatus Marinimicrobia bacterium]|nr:phospho-N-acetylmuramoyl-pentapeptide-transferase [Candidatus Neomarinimicrobiota bacterium]
MITYLLTKYFPGIFMFGNVTFRAGMATITALIISFVIGPKIIRLLRKNQIGESIKSYAPKTHQAKSGTPTMGGFIILFSLLVPTILWAKLNYFVWLIIVATAWMGIVGYIDDYLKVIRKKKKGLIARYKLVGQISLGLFFGIALLWFDFGTSTTIPFFKNLNLDWEYFFIPMVILVITGSSNAVNLTDGLDGLVAGLIGICAVIFGLMAYVGGRSDFSEYLLIQHIPGVDELAVFATAMLGAGLGFLWFNSKPASVFMGDTGSLALGSALGAMAILVKKELLLPLVGGVFFIEALSVILQVGFFKYSKRKKGIAKRLFKMAPIHHHFELSGWDENKVVTRFWIIGLLLGLIAMVTFKVR